MRDRRKLYNRIKVADYHLPAHKHIDSCPPKFFMFGVIDKFVKVERSLYSILKISIVSIKKSKERGVH